MNNVKWVPAERKQTKSQAQKRDNKFESSYQWKAMLAKGLDPSAIAPSIKMMTYIPFMLCFKRCYEVTLQPESIRLLHLEHVFRKNIKPLSWLYHTDCCDLLFLGNRWFLYQGQYLEAFPGSGHSKKRGSWKTIPVSLLSTIYQLIHIYFMKR